MGAWPLDPVAHDVARELTPEKVRRAARSLAQRDSDLARLLEEDGPPPMWSRRPGFASLVQMILEQQVSLASAGACFDKLRVMTGRLTPRRFLMLSVAQLKRAGFSRQKAAYCRGMAESIVSGELDLPRLAGQSDDRVRAALTGLRGVGEWTADVYLLMALNRPDVWPAGDLALAEAVKDVKRMSRRPGPEVLVSLAESWRPWRSVAARLLWQRYLKQR